MPPFRLYTGIAIIVIAALLAVAAATTPTSPPAGHTSPAPAADATPADGR